MTVYQTAGLFVGERKATIYFKPEYNNKDLQEACLEMIFKASTYFAGKIVFLLDFKYKEELLYRSLTTTGKDVKRWQTNIASSLLINQPFIFVIEVKSTEVGEMATIRKFKLYDGGCEKTGVYANT